ncbi:hypothetical protein M0R72_12310 [Candidatus Pacearchaeota archaeon]|jgi:hypothetical protein|nr:hypothetical protein [Candidatus Pacearchaeota archaeon]
MVENNPNIIEVELTLSQLEYMEKWSKKLNGMETATVIRIMVDVMMKTNPL